jgi:hypothetical protein
LVEIEVHDLQDLLPLSLHERLELPIHHAQGSGAFDHDMRHAGTEPVRNLL